jgi:coproporphyrinogen III oxidase-like Fe-S oxidoreductase
MERPERKIYNFLQIALQAEENRRYEKAMKEYNEWLELEKETKRLENERLKLENEEKRALIEGLRKQQGIGGAKNMYDRVKPEPEQEKTKENWLSKLWKS